MSINDNLDELLRALDPLTSELKTQNAARRDPIWASVASQADISRPKARLRRRLVGAGSLAVVATSAALVFGLLAETTPLTAVASTLTDAAQTARPAASLDPLAAGQFYFQNNVVNAQCSFNLPSSVTIVHYNSAATVQVWINANGDAQTTTTPLPDGINGSGWATSIDKSQWLEAGSPFNPCAPSTSTNQQPANYTGGPLASVGVDNISMPALTTNTIDSSNANAILESLPTDPSALKSQLAFQYGSASLVLVNGVEGSQSTEFTLISNTLLTLPDASVRLAPILYGVFAKMPGVVLSGSHTDSLGRTGTALQEPTSGGSIVIDRSTGTLLESFQAVSTSASPTLPTGTFLENQPLSSTTYGPISVVDGLGTIPNGR
jgi:hypothetical protein